MNGRINEPVTVMGGGTGTYTVIRGLRRIIGENLLTSIHTTADSGGSSRKLMDEYGLPLPMGDLRQGLVAQSRSRRLWRDLFAYRFAPSEGTAGVGGHSLGNLILRALEDLNAGDLLEALTDAEQILNTVGHVLPVSLEQTTLCAELADGTVLRGEDRIDQPGPEPRPSIRRVYLEPQPEVLIRARKALERSAHIVIGPGDLYTSILPTLLVDGVCDAIAESDAEVIFIVNLMTKRGETDGYRASDFVEVFTRYLGRSPDIALVHTEGHRPERLAQYADSGATPVEPDVDRVRPLVGRVLTGDFVSEQHFIRHDADKLLEALWPE
ncbi:MAG TPA: gluconeogenesis factor YvcK family protein, partial [Thermomicrobiales bacterium]|nr:gluconeogenesis factor YvcK family protein [Thermomicrobiales bacterium]